MQGASKMQVNSLIKSASIQGDKVLIICPKTGIQSHIILPACPGKILSYQHPLAEYSVAKEIVTEGIDYLRKLDISILAGLILTIYHRHELLAYGRETAIEENKILQTAGIEILIKALSISRQFNPVILTYAPQFSLDWSTHSSSVSIASSFLSYLKQIEDIIHPPVYTKAEISTLPAKLRLLSSAKKPTKDFEEEFRRIKAEAKLILQDTLIDAKFKAYLDQIFTKRNLLLINDDLRAKIASKCSTVGLDRLAEIISKTIDPCTDIFAGVDSAFESASEIFSQKPKKSLAQILEEKRAREHRGFIKQTEQEPAIPAEAELEDQNQDQDDPYQIEDEYLDPSEDAIEEEYRDWREEHGTF